MVHQFMPGYIQHPQKDRTRLRWNSPESSCQISLVWWVSWIPDIGYRCSTTRCHPRRSKSILRDLCCDSAYRYRFLVHFQLICEFFECALRIIRRLKLIFEHRPFEFVLSLAVFVSWLICSGAHNIPRTLAASVRRYCRKTQAFWL